MASELCPRGHGLGPPPMLQMLRVLRPLSETQHKGQSRHCHSGGSRAVVEPRHRPQERWLPGSQGRATRSSHKTRKDSEATQPREHSASWTVLWGRPPFQESACARRTHQGSPSSVHKHSEPRPPTEKLSIDTWQCQMDGASAPPPQVGSSSEPPVDFLSG